MVMSPAGLRPKNDCAGDGQQQLQMTDLPSHQRGCYIRTIIASVQLKIMGLKGLGTKTN
jgi:hypothetical protein